MKGKQADEQLKVLLIYFRLNTYFLTIHNFLIIVPVGWTIHH